MDGDDPATGACCLVRQDDEERAPPRVTDALRQMMVLDHSTDVQIFHFDALVLIYQLYCLFEMKISSLPLHLQMLLPQPPHRLLSPFASFDTP